ncbi:MAG: ArnT family glycosyltransferase, partial [Nitrosotalea sp.]
MSSSAINESQMVYGDMHTLYLSKQVEEGKTLYKDLQILYGPILYLTGAGLLGLGASYAGMKLFMILIAIASGYLVFLISKKAFSGDNRIGVLSAAIYMFLPIHYGVAPIFHADSFAVLFILISAYCLLVNKNKSLIIAAIFASFAIFTKMPAIPLTLVPMIYYIINKRKEGLFYIIPFFAIVGSTLAYITTFAHNNDNVTVIFRYLLKDPNPPFSILQDLVWIEGLAIFVGFMGFVLYLKKNRHRSIISFMPFAAIISFGAILVRGVGIYEINYLEPFIAIFAAFAVLHLKDNWKSERTIQKLVVALIIVCIFAQCTVFVLPDRERVASWHGDRWAKEVN